MHSISIDNVKNRSSTASLRAAGCTRSPRRSFGALTPWLLLCDWAKTSVYRCLVTRTRTSELYSGRSRRIHFSGRRCGLFSLAGLEHTRRRLLLPARAPEYRKDLNRCDWRSIAVDQLRRGEADSRSQNQEILASR